MTLSEMMEKIKKEAGPELDIVGFWVQEIGPHPGKSIQGWGCRIQTSHEFRERRGLDTDKHIEGQGFTLEAALEAAMKEMG